MVLVPEGRELHEVAVDVLVVVVLVLEGDVRPRLRVARRLGPEGEAVDALVVGHQEGGQPHEGVEVLVRVRGRGRVRVRVRGRGRGRVRVRVRPMKA